MIRRQTWKAHGGAGQALCPQMRDGYLCVDEKPGWGIEMDKAAAAKAPFTSGRSNLNGGWSEIRRPDGKVIRQ